MTEAVLIEPEVAERLRVSLACLLRWHLERRGARFHQARSLVRLLGRPAYDGQPCSKSGLQRVPVPIGMWNPVKAHRSVPLRLSGPAILEVAGEQASILFCYGPLLSWPILQSAVERPTLVGLADNNWVHGTTIPVAQQVAVTALARLFRFSRLLALNL